jgi:regulator of sigma E protease
VPKGWQIGTTTMANYVGSMKHLFSRRGVESIGGFGSLGNLFSASGSWFNFWMVTAFLSVALAFMNIIPIPALDGGHVLFLLYEIVTRRQPSMRFLEVAQYLGMGFLLLLMVWANLNDILRL